MSLGHTAFINESKGKKGESGIRETKRKHLLKTIYWLQTLVRKAHLGCLLCLQPATLALPNLTSDASMVPDFYILCAHCLQDFHCFPEAQFLEKWYLWQLLFLRSYTKIMAKQNNHQRAAFKMVILKLWFPHCPQGLPVCCLSKPCVLCPSHTHLSPAPFLLSHWTLFLLPTTLWPASCCWRVRCLSFLRRLRCSFSVLWLSGPGKTIENGPQGQQEAEDGNIAGQRCKERPRMLAGSRRSQQISQIGDSQGSNTCFLIGRGLPPPTNRQKLVLGKGE